MAKKDEGMSPNVMLVIGLIACGGLVVIAMAATRLMGTAPEETRKPAPVAAPVAQSVNTTLKYSSGYYKATVEEDAKKYKISPPNIDQLALPLPYSDELSAPRIMKADKDQLDTPHLHLATHVTKEWASTGTAANLRVEHLMLTITNKSDRPVAYRVETKFGDSARCKNKAAIQHNAVALKPGESITRSECMWAKNMSLEVDRIETIELTDLGYFYASRLVPQQALLGDRVTQGHVPPNKLPLCSFVPWREIRASSESKGGVDWADVLDFYARHNCDEYTFFANYRRWTAPGSLPAQPTAAAPPVTAPATTP
jgi:hypothetical protein